MRRLALAALAFSGACSGSSSSEPPSIDTITPGYGPLGGGTRVLIAGAGFERDGASPNRVLFGTTESPQAGVVDDASLEAVVPPSETAGDVPITVFNRNGNVIAMGKFHYSPAPVITSMAPSNVLFSSTNTTVTVTGSGFQDEGAGIPDITVNGRNAVDVTIQSDTQLTFSAQPGKPLNRPTVELTNTRGVATKERAFRYVPSLNPGLVLFPKNTNSVFVIFYDPATDMSVTIPTKDATNQPGMRGVYTDVNGDTFVLNRNNQFGKIDFETQLLVDPQAPTGQITSLSRMGTMVYAFDRSGNRFGTFDPATALFTQISTGIVCTPVGGFGCAPSIVNDGTTMYMIYGTSISTVNTTTGVRGTLHTLAPASEISEARFLNGTLYAVGATARPTTNVVFSINPNTGAVVNLHTFPGTLLSSLEVFQP